MTEILDGDVYRFIDNQEENITITAIEGEICCCKTTSGRIYKFTTEDLHMFLEQKIMLKIKTVIDNWRDEL